MRDQALHAAQALGQGEELERGGPGPEAGQSEGGSKEDVVDAEFEEVDDDKK